MACDATGRRAGGKGFSGEVPAGADGGFLHDLWTLRRHDTLSCWRMDGESVGRWASFLFAFHSLSTRAATAGGGQNRCELGQCLECGEDRRFPGTRGFFGEPEPWVESGDVLSLSPQSIEIPARISGNFAGSE
jgi:hypothetical protein